LWSPYLSTVQAQPHRQWEAETISNERGLKRETRSPLSEEQKLEK